MDSLIHLFGLNYNEAVEIADYSEGDKRERICTRVQVMWITKNHSAKGSTKPR
jgi:hypothetical protein